MDNRTGAIISIIAVAAIAVTAVAMVPSAFSYSSTVITEGNVTSEYITINVYDDDSAAAGLSFTFNKNEWTADNATTDGYEVTGPGGAQYAIKAQSNRDAGAYLYGYFTGGGAGIRSITFTFAEDAPLEAMTIYRNAPAEEMELEDSDQDTNVWLFPIESIRINCYEGLQLSADNKIPVTEDDTTQQILIDNLFSIDGLSLHFFTSWDSLIRSSS